MRESDTVIRKSDDPDSGGGVWSFGKKCVPCYRKADPAPATKRSGTDARKDKLITKNELPIGKNSTLNNQ